MEQNTRGRVTLSSVLEHIDPDSHLFIVHRLRPHECERRVYDAEVAQQTFERNIKRRGERAAAR